MNTLPVKKEFNYAEKNKVSSPKNIYESFYYDNHNPFVLCFVYPANEDGFIVKGDKQSVVRWLNENCKNYISFTVVHDKHRKHSYVTLRVDGYQAHAHSNRKKYEYQSSGNPFFRDNGPFTLTHQRGFKFYLSLNGKTIFEKVVRRIPRQFPKELLPFVK